MTDITIACLCLSAIMVLLACRVPIAIALGSVSFLGIWAIKSPRAALGTIAQLPFDFASSWELSAIPMFLLMGAVAYHTGMTTSLFRAARMWFSGVPGGLAVATNLTAAGFAAASGSSVATAAAVGRLAIPEMLKYGYAPSLATGTVAAAGTLGALIPPSIAFVLYGWFTGESVGQLLIAGAIPGIMTAAIYCAMIIGRCALDPSLAPPVKDSTSWRERFAVLREIWPLPMLILGVIGSIYGGIATPTEAGALGALFALIIGAMNRQLSFSAIARSGREALRTTSSLFFLAIGASILTRFLAMAGVPSFVAELVASYHLGAIELVVTISIIYLILGMFLDPIGVMLLTLPVFMPAFKALDLNMIWIGVIIVKLIEIGLLTPPVGLNVYVVKGVVRDAVPIAVIFQGVLWFLLCELVIMFLLIAFPQISLFLPQLMH